MNFELVIDFRLVFDININMFIFYVFIVNKKIFLIIGRSK